MAKPRKAYTTEHLLLDPFVQPFVDPVNKKLTATGAGYWNDLAPFAEWLMQTRGETYRTPAEFARAITPTDVREYRDRALADRRAPATINRRLNSQRAFARWSIEQGFIDADPAAKIQPIKTVDTAPRWLDRLEQNTLRRSAEKDGDARNQAILLLMLNAGLRVSEVVGLILGDVKLGERKGEVVVRGKGQKVRTVPLNADIRHALTAYLKKRPKVKHEALFVGQKGEPLGKLGIEYTIGVLARLAELDHCTPHTLRHTFAKNLIDAGVSIDQVAMLMGHRHLTTTARYTKPSQQDLARAVEKIEIK